MAGNERPVAQSQGQLMNLEEAGVTITLVSRKRGLQSSVSFSLFLPSGSQALGEAWYTSRLLCASSLTDVSFSCNFPQASVRFIRDMALGRWLSG